MAPKAETKPESKAPAKAAAKGKAEKTGDKKKKGGKPKGTESYKIYIFKVLKQVHPDTGISSKVGCLLLISDGLGLVHACRSKLAVGCSRTAKLSTGTDHIASSPHPSAGHGHPQLVHRGPV